MQRQELEFSIRFVLPKTKPPEDLRLPAGTIVEMKHLLELEAQRELHYSRVGK
jgi:hypothetical protein